MAKDHIVFIVDDDRRVRESLTELLSSYDMHAVAGDQLAKMEAESVVRAGGNVVELVHSDQPVVEFFDAILVNSEAERRVRAHQHLVRALKKRRD